MSLVFSEELQDLIDAVVSSTLDGQQNICNLTPLYEFIEADGMDEVMLIWRGEIAIEIDGLASCRFDDASAIDHFDLEAANELTDAMRVEYAIEQATRAVEESGDFCVSVHAFPLIARDGRSAFLGFTLWTFGTLDQSITWMGFFRNEYELYATIENRGYWLVNADWGQRAAELLARWQR